MFGQKRRSQNGASKKTFEVDTSRFRKNGQPTSQNNWDKDLIRSGEITLFQQRKYARAIADVMPGKIGKVCCDGVYWKARCKSDVAIAEGETALVVGRHNPTLTLLVTTLDLSW